MTRKAAMTAAIVLGGVLSLRAIGIDVLFPIARAEEFAGGFWLVAVACLVAYRLGQWKAGRSRIRQVQRPAGDRQCSASHG